ncbi:MAG: DedA family protein [Ectothiorhodospiraceae bacterium]|nr:DedA family protein [Chromatiales bacterium]MCP5155518.1 DedA family protein [Ectothiorhodospiraceae bacterium]
MTVYLSVFASAFLAATIVPFYSEIAVASALLVDAAPWLVFVAATAGNTLGAAVNYVLGRYLLHFRHRRWFPLDERGLARSQAWFQRWGVWSLLLAWLPVGGDALTVVAGVMRVPFWLFLTLTGVGKAARYAVVIFLLEAAR